MPNPTRRPEVFIFEAEAKSILAAAESFARLGFRVVAGSSHSRCLGFYSRFVRERVVYPHEVEEAQRCVEFLLEFVRRRRFEMILPLGDVVTKLVCSRREEFLKHTKLVLVPFETFMICRDKVETMKAAERHGVPIPKTYDPEAQSFDVIDRELDYPVLVKPAESNGARGIHYAHNRGEMERLYRDVKRDFGRTFIQEMIPHDGMQYKTELLLDYDGTVLASFGYAKIRFYPPTGGSSTLNLTTPCPEMIEHATRLAQGIGWYGICDFDWIHDVRDNTPKLMEINPRVTDTVQMGNFAGVDFFEPLYKMACGEKVEPNNEYQSGIYMRFMPGELMWFVKTKQPRFTTKPNFFRFFGDDIRYLVTSLADPGPTIGYVLDAFSAMFDPKQRAFLLRTQKKGNDGNGGAGA